MKADFSQTPLLDYGHPSLQRLIDEQGWKTLTEKEKILAVYDHVRDAMVFGFNAADDIPASRVLRDGYGQCNTKGILFMALLRALEIPCRVHGFTVDKRIQKGVIRGLFYRLSPGEILHSWVEVYHHGRWYNLEGFILDVPYLAGLQAMFPEITGTFRGYGVATDDFKNPRIYWDGNDTCIQKEGIIRDLGVYESPDELFTKHRQRLGRVKNSLYKYLVRHLMNRRVAKIRGRLRPGMESRVE